MAKKRSVTPLPTIDADSMLSIIIRVVVWLSFFAVLYLLKSFFLLIFLTFVFAYIQSNAVGRMAGFIANRTVRVFISASLLLGVLITVGSFVVPQVRKEAEGFAEKLPSYVDATDQEIVRIREKYPLLDELLPSFIVKQDAAATIETESPHRYNFNSSPTGLILHKLFSFGDGDMSGGDLIHTLDALRNVGAYLAAVGSAFFLSLLFSFLIVLDMPSLTNSARSLAQTKIGFIYHEVAPSIANFATVLGRAIEAQLFIALLNTFLTGIGLLVLGLGSKLAFISLIVFACSFIPVAGVFLSSVPICLMALQQGGFFLAFLAVILIIVAHMVEAYILNPRIYGLHLRMNPVVVLMILTMSGKLFGIWGLILGVPICTYIFGHAIQYHAQHQASH
jgi:predicted PurR-regulated permease PerM